MKNLIRMVIWAGVTAALLMAGACKLGNGVDPPTGPTGPSAPSTANAWSFGIMSDTQWTTPPGDDGRNPGTSAIDIITRLNTEFISKKVKFVVAVGDLVDSSTAVTNEDIRATYAQALYNAGIGFYPLRGNHESAAAAATEFLTLYPQTQTGVNNQTPTAAFAVQGTTDPAVSPPAKSGGIFSRGSNFSSPSSSMNGLSYSFDYGNARLILLDQFTPGDGSANSIDSQQGWITGQLSGRSSNTHAFIFGHKGIITENHVDNLFGANPGANATGENAFIQSMFQNKAHYYIGGHDHMHDRSIVSTTAGSGSGNPNITQLVAVSDSSKFYIPANPSNDQTYDAPARQIPISQELNTVGYYIVTVDGANVTVDFYSAAVNPTLSSGEYLLSTTPSLSFTKRETFGYSLAGKEFVIAQGASYTAIQDSYPSGSAASTSVKILNGMNANTAVDPSSRQMSLAVDTGWISKTTGLYSDIVTLWGMGYTMGSPKTDTYTLSLSCSGASGSAGDYGLLQLDSSGTKWVNAVANNIGGSAARFVNGPWTASSGLGTYGVDTTTNPPTAWAVINTGGTFAVGPIVN